MLFRLRDEIVERENKHKKKEETKHKKKAKEQKGKGKVRQGRAAKDTETIISETAKKRIHKKKTGNIQKKRQTIRGRRQRQGKARLGGKDKETIKYEMAKENLRYDHSGWNKILIFICISEQKRRIILPGREWYTGDRSFRARQGVY